MTEAPQELYFYDDWLAQHTKGKLLCGNNKYIHADHVAAMLAKAREDALREAASVCRDNAPLIEHDSTQDDRMHEAILERAARHIEALIDRTAEGEA